jgi:hypothetical protein
MSIITLAQIAEKPITVATDDAISSFADTRHGSLAMLVRHPNSIDRSRSFWMRPNHCCRLKWRQRCMNELTVGCRCPAESHDRFGAAPPRTKVNDYDALRNYLKKQTRPEFVLSFEQIEEIIDAALPRAAHRASWWETLRSPQEKMPQREACLAGGYIATRLADGKSVRFKRMK